MTQLEERALIARIDGHLAGHRAQAGTAGSTREHRSRDESPAVSICPVADRVQRHDRKGSLVAIGTLIAKLLG
jgi:hypothetical protein